MNCGLENALLREKCSLCDHQLPKETTTCKKCGKPISLDWIRCNACSFQNEQSSGSKQFCNLSTDPILIEEIVQMTSTEIKPNNNVL